MGLKVKVIGQSSWSNLENGLAVEIKVKVQVKIEGQGHWGQDGQGHQGQRSRSPSEKGGQDHQGKGLKVIGQGDQEQGQSFKVAFLSIIDAWVVQHTSALTFLGCMQCNVTKFLDSSMTFCVVLCFWSNGCRCVLLLRLWFAVLIQSMIPPGGTRTQHRSVQTLNDRYM